MPIALPLPHYSQTLKKSRAQWPCLAGALNPSEPIKEPQTHGTGDVKNHLADSNFYLAIRCCRSHHFSFSPKCKQQPRISSATFLTHRYSYVIQNSLPHTKNQGNSMKKKSKVFDIIVLAGMVVNILLAVFLILYYFDFL